MAPPQRSGNGCGCLSGGCLAFVVVMAILLGLAGVGGYIFYQKAREYTSTEAAAIPIYQASPEKLREVNDRVDAFKKAYESNAEAQLELSGDDINSIIATSPKWEEMKGKIYVRVADNLFYVDASVPLTQVAGFSDRYLNGTVGFDVSVENGQPKLMPKTVELNGKGLPPSVQQSAGEGFSEGFVEEIQKNPDTKAFFERVKSLKVQGDRVHIHIVPATAPAYPPDSGLAPGPAQPQMAPPQQQMPAAPAAPPASGQTFVCPQQIMAYDQNLQPLGYFLQGSTLEILGPSASPGMIAVRYREPAGNVIEALCKAEDLGMGAAPGQPPAEPPAKPEFQGLGGSKRPEENPNYKGFGKP